MYQYIYPRKNSYYHIILISVNGPQHKGQRENVRVGYPTAFRATYISINIVIGIVYIKGCLKI